MSIRPVQLMFMWCLCAFTDAAEPASTSGSVHVTVTGLQSERGAVRMALYAEAKQDAFPTERSGAMATQRMLIRDLTANGRFADLAPGNYAIAVFHDLDDDDVLATNWLGIPREPVGVSNNAKGTLGPPSFAAASFSLRPAESVEVAIRVE